MEEYSNAFSPEKNRIKEIRTYKRRRKRRPKTRIPFSTLAGILTLCVIVSALSGAGGAFLIHNLLYKAEESVTKQEFIIDEQLPPVSEESTVPAEAVITPSGNGATEESTIPSSAENDVPSVPALSKGDIYAEAVNSIVAIKTEWKQYYSSIFGSYYRPATSSGTGFVITENGYIITNYHVIENAETVTVTDYDGRTYTARIVGSEPENDVAVIKIDAATKPVTLGNSSELAVGDDIMVIGNALGQLSYSFTDGIVSHLSRAVTMESGKTINMFQTNAAINNGNSGGPVYNMSGEVIGIASAKYTAEAIEGLGFCIPVDDIKDMISDIIIFGYVTGKPSLGISVQTVSSSMSARYSLPTGCYIVDLDGNSPCYQAGLRSGDVITKLSGKTIDACEDIADILKSKKAGDSINITYYSSGNTKTVSITLTESKPSEPRTSYSNVYDY